MPAGTESCNSKSSLPSERGALGIALPEPLAIVATHETGIARRWFKLSIPGSNTACELSGDALVGDSDRSVDGKARDDK